jgi:hypothetical protein
MRSITKPNQATVVTLKTAQTYFHADELNYSAATAAAYNASAARVAGTVPLRP